MKYWKRCWRNRIQLTPHPVSLCFTVILSSHLASSPHIYQITFYMNFISMCATCPTHLTIIDLYYVNIIHYEAHPSETFSVTCYLLFCRAKYKNSSSHLRNISYIVIQFLSDKCQFVKYIFKLNKWHLQLNEMG